MRVTRNNYEEVRSFINHRIDRFLINSESWILQRFLDSPPLPSREAVDHLNLLINQFLPQRVIRELTQRFPAKADHPPVIADHKGE
ncbi:MAG: hypothetical protein HQL82_09020 [Magnetococcales bacterium]|nr:hypothetical protein [Magnetococcales bacterium]